MTFHFIYYATAVADVKHVPMHDVKFNICIWSNFKAFTKNE